MNLIEKELAEAEKHLKYHCGKCDAVDCKGCSYDHIKNLLGIKTLRGGVSE